MLTQEELLELARKYPKIWRAGYEAGLRGDSAALCPYTPLASDKMNVWLSGFVTATEE